MPRFELSDIERSLAESMRFFGYHWEDAVYWLCCATSERKVHEVFSIWVRAGARMH